MGSSCVVDLRDFPPVYLCVCVCVCARAVSWKSLIAETPLGRRGGLLMGSPKLLIEAFASHG